MGLLRRGWRPPLGGAQLEAALVVLREHGPKARLQEALAQLADLRRAQGDLAGATDLYAEALNIHH